MSPVVTIVLPAGLALLAVALLRRELRLYRGAQQLGSELFVYGRGRLLRRLVGIAVLLGLAATFVVLGLAPPQSAAGASEYLGWFSAELVVLVVLPVWDLIEMGRSSARKRSQPGRPRSQSS